MYNDIYAIHSPPLGFFLQSKIQNSIKLFIIYSTFKLKN